MALCLFYVVMPIWTVQFYKDGMIVDYGDGFRSGKTVRGGGTEVLGQDQDVQGGAF